MSLFSAAFKAECQKGVSLPGQPEIYPVLTLALPSGTRRYCGVGLASAALGFAEPLIEEGGWGSISRTIDLRGNNLQTILVSPMLSDPERIFSAEVARYRRSLHGVAATIDLVSPNVPHANRFVAFSGALDAWEEIRPLSWRLSLGPDDSWLQFGQLPKATIQPPDWPDADPAVYGTFIPIVYGIHNSSGITNAGMVPTYYVDTVGFRYLLCLGKAKAVTAVYVDGTVTATSNYSVTYVTVNGKQITLIDFTSDQGTAEITADVQGLTDDGTTTGALIVNPAEQLEHALHNFAFGDWRSGAYLTGAPLNAASIVVVGDFLDAMGHEGSQWIGGDKQTGALEFLQSWLESHEAKAFWTNGGELAFVVNDHRTTSIYLDDPWFQADFDEQRDGQLSVPYETQSLLRELIVSYVFGQVAGKYHQTVRVQDLSVSDPVSRGRELPWSAARVL